MLHILYGPDTYSRQIEQQNITRKLGDESMLSVNTSLFGADDLNLDKLKNVCEVTPFLNPYRLIIVEGLLKLFEADKSRKSAKLTGDNQDTAKLKAWKLLADYVDKMPSSTILILVDDKINEKNSLLKLLRSKGQIRKFGAPTVADLIVWINDEAKKGGGSINQEALRLLIDLSGSDLWSLKNEIGKLISYCGSREITKEDVKQLTTYSKETNIFNLVDAIMDKKAKEAETLLKYLGDEGETPLRMLNMILRQLRLIVKAKQINPKRYSQSEVFGILGLASEFAVNKTLAQAKKYSIEQLKEIYHKMLEADINIKTGIYEEDLAIHLLVAELCESKNAVAG